MNKAFAFVDTKDLDWEEAPDRWKIKYADGDPGLRFKAFHTGSPVVPFGMLVEYEPGHHEGQHSHPEDEFFFMLEGDMQVFGQSVTAGTLVFIPARSPYSVMAGAKGALFLRLGGEKPRFAVSESGKASMVHTSSARADDS